MITEDEYNRLSPIDIPTPHAHATPVIRPPQFTEETRIDPADPDGKGTVTYYRAKVWIRANTWTPPETKGKLIQVQITLDRDVLQNYSAGMLETMLWFQFQQAVAALVEAK